MAMTLTVDPCLLPISIGATAKMLNKVINSAVSSVRAWIVEDGAADGINIVKNLESEETLDLLATKRAESKLPSLQELQRFADANPPAQSWYDEDL
ncbi:MAG: hypothetical protein ACLQU5_04515 [Isosphaeraceae bacterium]